MQQNNDTELRKSFSAYRKFERLFVAKLTEFRGAKVKKVMESQDAGVAAFEWDFDYTFKHSSSSAALEGWKIIGKKLYTTHK